MTVLFDCVGLAVGSIKTKRKIWHTFIDVVGATTKKLVWCRYVITVMHKIKSISHVVCNKICVPILLFLIGITLWYFTNTYIFEELFDSSQNKTKKLYTPHTVINESESENEGKKWIEMRKEKWLDNYTIQFKLHMHTLKHVNQCIYHSCFLLSLPIISVSDVCISLR